MSWDYVIFISSSERAVSVCWLYRLIFYGEIRFGFIISVFIDLENLVLNVDIHAQHDFYKCNKYTVGPAWAHTLTHSMSACAVLMLWEMSACMFTDSLWRLRGLCLLQVSRCWVVRQRTAERHSADTFLSDSYISACTHSDKCGRKAAPCSAKIDKRIRHKKRRKKKNRRQAPTPTSRAHAGNLECRCLSVEVTKWSDCMQINEETPTEKKIIVCI